MVEEGGRREGLQITLKLFNSSELNLGVVVGKQKGPPRTRSGTRRFLLSLIHENLVFLKKISSFLA